MKARATVYDVARLSGVSIKTVSRVVNGAPEVTAKTRDKVLAAMAELGYRRNPFAHSLRTGSSATVGVVVDSIADTFFSRLVSVVEDRLLVEGFSVLVGSTGREPQRERDQVDRMLEQNVAGLLLVPTGGDHTHLQEVDLPLVLLDRGWERSTLDVVGVQDRAGGLLATAHLLRHGHRRVAFLGGSDSLPTVAGRLQGYREALGAEGIGYDPGLVRTDSAESAEAAQAVRELLAIPDPPTAFFASNQRAGIGVVSCLHELGRTDAALVSFGDFDLAATVTPAVSYIDQDPLPIGLAATERLLARMRGDTGAPQLLELPLTLVGRGSGELRPVH